MLSQQRFAYGDTEDPTVFVVPVHLRIDGTESKVLLEGFETRIALPSPQAAVVVNSGGHGFMRVAYDTALRGRLVGAEPRHAHHHRPLQPGRRRLERSRRRRLAAADFLTFVEGFAAERDLAVWQVIGTGLRGIAG